MKKTKDFCEFELWRQQDGGIGRDWPADVPTSHRNPEKNHKLNAYSIDDKMIAVILKGTAKLDGEAVGVAIVLTSNQIKSLFCLKTLHLIVKKGRNR